MSSKDQILARVRKHPVPDRPLPDLTENWIRYPDRNAQFAEVLQSVGGQARFVPDRSRLNAEIAGLDCLRDARKIVCTVPGVSLGNTDLAAIADPHELEDVDVAIVAGAFAVAENGAVWVTGNGLRHRAILFITQHLVLVVPHSEIIDNLHEAYGRLQFDSPDYGLFISGPSKTADIEQSLVIGAHGPRSLTVVFAPQ